MYLRGPKVWLNRWDRDGRFGGRFGILKSDTVAKYNDDDDDDDDETDPMKPVRKDHLSVAGGHALVYC